MAGTSTFIITTKRERMMQIQTEDDCVQMTGVLYRFKFHDIRTYYPTSNVGVTKIIKQWQNVNLLDRLKTNMLNNVLRYSAEGPSDISSLFPYSSMANRGVTKHKKQQQTTNQLNQIKHG